MDTNRFLFLAATLAILPAAISCDRPSAPSGDSVALKVGAMTGTAAGLGTRTWTLPPYADPLKVPLSRR